jgi:adenylate cyclase
MSETGYGDFEFERRFYVEELPAVVMDDPTPTLIIQNYFLAQDGYALRIRAQAPGVRLVMDGTEDIDAILEQHTSAFDFCAMTVKGPMNSGTRYEAERELDVNVALNMLTRGSHRIIKNRYSVWLGTDGWVVDAFGGANFPLLVAEVERGSPVTDLSIPSFCVSEITEDKRFSNEALSHTPFGLWATQYGVELGAAGPTFMESLGANTFQD